MTDSTEHVALITGASRGLGLALARVVAQQHWSLIIDGRDATTLRRAQTELARSTHVVAIAGDIAAAGHRAELAAAARTIGHIDALVNNASILGLSPQPELLHYPLDVFAEVYGTNVFAPLELIQQIQTLLAPGAVVMNIV